MSDNDAQEFEHDEAQQEMHDLEDIKLEEEADAEEEEEVDPNSAANYSETKIIGLEDEGGDEDQDVNEEDEDDEEDDDEEEINSGAKSNKRRRRERNQFLDVEAEVSDDDEDEDEDEDELTKEGFIEHDHDNEEPLQRDDRLHRQVDRTHEKSTEEDAQKLAATFKERYGRTNKYRGEDTSGGVAQRFLLPSISDPSIWAIRCRPGKEKDLVGLMLKKMLTLAGKPNELKIYSAFQRKNFVGYIYLEADKVSAVDDALKGVSDVYPNNRTLVPVEEFPDLLRVSKSNEITLNPGNYVRIKRGKYKGDLAIVDSIDESGLEVTLQVIPRLNYASSQEIDPATGKRKRENFQFRPPQRLFSKKDALENDPTNFQARSNNSFIYKGDEYIDGFLFKTFKVQFLETQNVQPSLEEISKFNSGNSDDLDLTSIAQSLKHSESVTFRIGDSVQVLHGEQQGLIGDIVYTSNEIAKIKPSETSIKEELEFPLSNLRKVFNEGDHIRVLKGKFSNHSGIVVSIKNDQITFISDQTKKDITVFANNLTKSEESSSYIEGDYELRDLVSINMNTFGVIIRLEKDIIDVLTQTGKIISIEPKKIIEKIKVNKNESFSTDSLGNPLKIGDSVKENTGLQREGVVLYIFKGSLFLFSKETVENSGVFVSESSSITSLASKSTNSNIKKSINLDLTKMNPKLRSGGIMAPPSSSASSANISLGRDKLINQSVSVRMGEYKGYRGIVKDTHGDLARVELHTKSKILSIAKTKLSVVTQDGLIPYEKFVQTREGFNSHVKQNPSFSSSSNAYNSNGGNTSWNNGQGWSSFTNGGKTPGRAGGRTAIGNNGSGTSWGGSGTAWGGAGSGTAWGGSTAAGNAGGSGTAWGANNGAGTAWGGGNGAGTAWGASGGASRWNQGGASQYGGSSQYGGASQYGSSSSWGKKPAGSEWRSRSGYTAPTPGAYADTPGSFAHTPYGSAQTPGVAQTPSSAQTPGGYTYDDDEDDE